jgi:hypothetical protein
MAAMLEMTVEGVARYGHDLAPPVVVLRAVNGTRRLSLGVCDRHANAVAEVVRGSGYGHAPTCDAARPARPDRVVGAHLAWDGDGPMGPRLRFGLVFERDGRTVEKPSCLFGIVKAILRHGVAVRVDERILDALRPAPGEPRWLAGPLGQPASEEPSGPLRAFIDGLEALDRL